MSLRGMYLHRGTAVRALRARMLGVHGVSPAARPTAHRIVVLLKVVEHPQNRVALPGLCATITSLAQRLAPPPAVACVTPARLSVREQLELAANTSLAVAEHGSTLYGALLQVPGTAVIGVVPDGAAKEVQVLLSSLDVNAYYLPAARLEQPDAAAALLLVLDRVGVRLNLPPVRLVGGSSR